MSRRRKAPSRDPLIAAVAALALDQLAGIQRHAEAGNTRALNQRLRRIERRTRAAGLHTQADAARILAGGPSDRVIAATLARRTSDRPRRTRRHSHVHATAVKASR